MTAMAMECICMKIAVKEKKIPYTSAIAWIFPGAREHTFSRYNESTVVLDMG